MKNIKEKINNIKLKYKDLDKNKKSKLLIFIIIIVLISVIFISLFTNNTENNYNIKDKIMLDTNKIDQNTGIVNQEYLSSWSLLTQNPRVTIQTNFGDINLELYADKAPFAVTNFVNLSLSGYYTDTLFHRVIKDFMIQGGDFNTRFEDKKNQWGMGGPGYNFKDEVYPSDNLIYGDIAMANSGKDTNGSQFFIVTAKETPWLNGKHTIFGKVTSGMDVVEKIQNVKTDSMDRPQDSVKILNIKVD